jgi:hypothetical protein
MPVSGKAVSGELSGATCPWRTRFTLEGRIREGWFHDGSWHDVLAYAILRIELNSLGG